MSDEELGRLVVELDFVYQQLRARAIRPVKVRKFIKRLTPPQRQALGPRVGWVMDLAKRLTD